MALLLWGARYRQWSVTSQSGGKRSFIVPVPDVDTMPKEVLLYQQCKWRREDMTLLEFLRKTNSNGGISFWLRNLWRKAGGESSLEDFANNHKCKGDSIVACDMVSRRNDKYYGQWLMLNVEFRSASEFLSTEVDDLVPATDKYLGMALTCKNDKARFWLNDDLINMDMQLEARTRHYREQILRQIRPHRLQVQKYLRGEARKPDEQADGRSKRKVVKHSLALHPKYNRMIREGHKTVEVRINCKPASHIMEGQRWKKTFSSGRSRCV